MDGVSNFAATILHMETVVDLGIDGREYMVVYYLSSVETFLSRLTYRRMEVSPDPPAVRRYLVNRALTMIDRRHTVYRQ